MSEQLQRDPVALITAALDEAISAIAGTGEDGDERTGESQDGLVSARVNAAGRLVGLRADPRVLRYSAEEFAERVVTAFNLAHDGLPAPDPAARQQRLRAAQQNSQDSMSQLKSALQDTLRQLVTDAGGRY